MDHVTLVVRNVKLEIHVGIQPVEFGNGAFYGHHAAHIIRNARTVMCQQGTCRDQKSSGNGGADEQFGFHITSYFVSNNFFAASGSPAGSLTSSLYFASSEGTQTSSRMTVCASRPGVTRFPVRSSAVQG